jgi:two-component system phosphate regulon sensor histidine kinase PhoR
MTFRRLSWKLLLATAAPVLLAHALVLIWVGVEWQHATAAESSWANASLRRIAIVSAIVAAGTIVILVVSQFRRWGRLLVRIAQAARGISSGDLNTHIEAHGSRELELLGRALDQMRQRLVGQVETMDHQRRTFESLLTELREGVVVTDDRARVVLLNPAAIHLLNLAGPRTVTAYTGLAVERCIPQLELQRLLARSSISPLAASSESTGDPPNRSESRLEIETPTGTRHLFAQVTDILLPAAPREVAPPRPGRLLVLTDITDLTRSVQMKTDFVTNASHELRTPLSTIRAAIETIQQLDLAAETESAERFLNVIDRQSARLEALASDLLDLSRVELTAGRFRPRPILLREFTHELHANFAQRMSAKQLRWEVDTTACARSTFDANPQLLRLVIDNLVDNAIKFTDAGKCIRFNCSSNGDSVTLSVIDEGCGILPEDQERVFERFYQVERARSEAPRGERGTGLGLSIVRHAVNAMEGSVALESTPGAGTRVSVTIPQAEGRTGAESA